MCRDCELHRALTRDASIHAAGDSSVEIGSGKARPKKKGTGLINIKWLKFKKVDPTQGQAMDLTALSQAQDAVKSGKLDGIPK